MKCLSRRKLTRTTSRIFGDVVGTSLWVLQYECLLILLCRRKKRGMRRNILSHPTLHSNSLYCSWWVKISSVISWARNETILSLNSMYCQTGRHFRGLETSTWVATSVVHEVAFTKYVIVVLPFFLNFSSLIMHSRVDIYIYLYATRDYSQSPIFSFHEIVDVDRWVRGPPWISSLGASETGESTKCPFEYRLRRRFCSVWK